MTQRSNYWTSINQRALSRRRLLKGGAVAGVGLAGAGLVGCGDDDDDDGAAATTPAGGRTPGASPSAATGQPVQGGTLRESTTSPPVDWDP